jgi:hypothetical protein
MSAIPLLLRYPNLSNSIHFLFSRDSKPTHLFIPLTILLSVMDHVPWPLPAHSPCTTYFPQSTHNIMPLDDNCYGCSIIATIPCGLLHHESQAGGSSANMSSNLQLHIYMNYGGYQPLSVIFKCMPNLHAPLSWILLISFLYASQPILQALLQLESYRCLLTARSTSHPRPFVLKLCTE